MAGAIGEDMCHWTKRSGKSENSIVFESISHLIDLSIDNMPSTRSNYQA